MGCWLAVVMKFRSLSAPTTTRTAPRAQRTRPAARLHARQEKAYRWVIGTILALAAARHPPPRRHLAQSVSRHHDRHQLHGSRHGKPVRTSLLETTKGLVCSSCVSAHELFGFLRRASKREQYY